MTEAVIHLPLNQFLANYNIRFKSDIMSHHVRHYSVLCGDGEREREVLVSLLGYVKVFKIFEETEVHQSVSMGPLIFLLGFDSLSSSANESLF